MSSSSSISRPLTCFGCVYLIRRTVHLAVFLERLFDESLDLLIRLCVGQPLSLHQALEKRLNEDTKWGEVQMRGALQRFQVS